MGYKARGNNFNRRDLFKIMPWLLLMAGCAANSDLNDLTTTLSLPASESEFASEVLLPTVEFTPGTAEPTYYTNISRSSGIPLEMEPHLAEYYQTKILPELEKYPPGFFENLGKMSPKILLTTNLESYHEDEDQWVPNGGVMMIYEDEPIIIIDIAGYDPSSVHHELYHLIEYCMSEYMSSQESISIQKELTQITENAGLKYLKPLGISRVLACDVNNLHGFASCYGAYSPGEDGATISENLLQGNYKYYDRLSSDPVLSAKHVLIKRAYFLMSNGEMDDDYFDNIYQGIVPRWTY